MAADDGAFHQHHRRKNNHVAVVIELKRVAGFPSLSSIRLDASKIEWIY